ncbi:MAG: hypothetical protein J6W89_00740 [Paludibacteraceae bacterium]|nr:hypothetical protein [Paludibacteraceae bacterium]
MKKLTLILLAVAISAMAFGWDAYVDGIYYNLNAKQKTAAVTKPKTRKCSSKHTSLPSGSNATFE